MTFVELETNMAIEFKNGGVLTFHNLTNKQVESIVDDIKNLDTVKNFKFNFKTCKRQVYNEEF